VDPFIGKGELFEASDAEAFRTIDDLVNRQNLLARSRYALDTHCAAVKAGYWNSTLLKVENQSQYQQAWLPGTANRLQTAAVPNKPAELCQRLVETLLVDPPKLDPEAEDDDETATKGADLAREYLRQDATEAGTDDLTLYAVALEVASARAAAYTHYWVDPVGGGSVPKQIKAHPQATDPARPFDAIDPVTGQPVPTTDYVLRYVTAGDEMGGGAKFTTHPAEAERVWVPRIRVDHLQREHVRFFPETAALHDAQAVVILHYCTVAEARRRWPETVGQMSDAEIVPLLGWTPQRPLALLPPMIRGKWREGAANPPQSKDRVVALDQRILFYYTYYGLAEPDYPEGIALSVSGANGGLKLGQDTLTATVERPSEAVQDETVTDTKDLDLPLAECRLLADTDERDPTGIAFIRRLIGGGEAGATMATGMMQAIDQVLNPVRYSIGTSAVDADDVESARATGDYVPVGNKDEVPQLEAPRDLPGAYFNFNDWLYDQLDASAGLRPPDRANEAKVKSGVALRIEVEEATKTLTRMNYAFHRFAQRHGRIKLQQAMKHFSVPQLLRYVGEDGAAKQEWFSGNDFARVGNVSIQSGTGTMLPATEKLNFALQLQQTGQIDADEAADVGRAAFQRTLGTSENPHVQRIERQVGSWLEGPPEGWEAQMAEYQTQVQAHAALATEFLAANPNAPDTALPPEPPAPWSPFRTLPMDAEPPIAAIRKRRLTRLMAKTEFSKFANPDGSVSPWQQLVVNAYTEAVQALQAATVPPVMPQTPGQTREVAEQDAEMTDSQGPGMGSGPLGRPA
jgi:hypothetical protein